MPQIRTEQQNYKSWKMAAVTAHGLPRQVQERASFSLGHNFCDWLLQKRSVWARRLELYTQTIYNPQFGCDSSYSPPLASPGVL